MRGTAAIIGRTARACVLPSLAATAAVAVLAALERSARPESVLGEDLLPVGWIHAQASLATAAVVVFALRAWPGFGRDRDQGAAVRRLRTGPAEGTLAAGLGALLALIVALGVGVGVLVALHPDWRPPTASGFVPGKVSAPADDADAPPAAGGLGPVLGPVLLQGGRLLLASPAAEPVDRIVLRPLTVFRDPAAADEVPVVVRGPNGEPFGSASFRAPRDAARIDVPADAAAGPWELERGTGGSGALLAFPDPSRIELRLAHRVGGGWNLAAGLGAWLLAAAVSLAAASAARRALGIRVLAVAAVGTGIAATIIGIVPVHRTLTDVARGRTAFGGWEPVDALGGSVLVAVLATAAVLGTPGTARHAGTPERAR